MGPGEELCGGICVNTNSDSKHCGECGNACADFISCVDGECQNVLPYGAPMPEALWA